jgi:hypothetical protein
MIAACPIKTASVIEIFDGFDLFQHVLDELYGEEFGTPKKTRQGNQSTEGPAPQA